MANFTVMRVWRMDRFSHKVIIISKNLDGFSLVNHGRFVKFAKLSRYTVCMYVCINCTHIYFNWYVETTQVFYPGTLHTHG